MSDPQTGVTRMSVNRATTFKSELTPLPMRVTQLQAERLREARNRDGLSVQEHVRRSLDIYLNKIEREYSQKEISIRQEDLPRPRQPDPEAIAAALASPAISAIRSGARRPAPHLVRK